MKSAKAKRPFMVVRWKFDDGESMEQDAVVVLRELADQHLMLNGVFDWRVNYYRAQANKIEALRRRLPTAKGSAEGGKSTAKKFARPALDQLILGCLERGEKTRDRAKEWADSFNVSADVVERHIKQVKARLAKG